MRNGARRVVVTGVGCVTPIGIGARALADGLRAARSAVRTITRFDASPFRSRIAAEVPDFRPQDFLEAKRAKRFDRFSQFAVVAAQLALEHARLDLGREDRDRVGTMMGSALGGVAYAEDQVGPTRGTASEAWTPRWPCRCSAARQAATSPSSSACTAPTPPTR